jgi:quinol-cytochrome oxidoreductase complex cytochrome b subunit
MMEGRNVGGPPGRGHRLGSSPRLVRRSIVWLDERIGFTAMLPFLRKKDVPIHRHSFWYYLGGMALFLFGLQIITGVLLLFYYRPSSDGAYESVQFLMSQVKFGWLIRSIHSWGANLMIFMAFIHMFSVMLLKAYRKPRELTWITGVGMLFMILGLGFTGYLLPWNELSYFATKVGTDIAGVMPVVGPFIRRVLRGGEDVSGATLTRFYALHVSVLPALAFLIVGLHVWLVQKLGMSVPPSVEAEAGPKESMKFFPNFFMRDLMGWLAALAILAAMAAFLPAQLGTKADPFASAPAGIKPEWYFMFMFQTLKYLPSHILGIEGELFGIIGFGVAALVLLLVPFLDRPSPGAQPSKTWTVLTVLAVVFILVMTYLGYTMNPTA